MSATAGDTRTIGIAAHARVRPDAVALVAGDRRLTYRQLDERVNRAARALIRNGAMSGDRIAIALRNGIEFFEAASAAARLDCEVVPVPWRSKRDEIAYLVADSNARVLLAEEDARETTASLDVAVLHAGHEYETALAREDPAPSGDEGPAPVRFRYYTSGTTGRPKAVERARPDIDTYLNGILSYPPMAGLTEPGEVHLVCGPLYHTAPCAFANYALLLGHAVAVMERFDAEECMQLVDRERVTWTHMVPINFVRILQLPDELRAPVDVSSVRKVLHAAAPCPVHVKRAIMEVFPPDTVWEYYGMTEGFATIASPQEWSRKPGTVGRPMPGVELKILDANGREVPAGEVGVIHVSSPRGRFEYAGAPEKTSAAWRGDLFTVGDMGYVDDDGYLFLTDRMQDLIISGGANVYPAEVESILLQHDAVADVAVIGIPDDEWGERVHAIVEPRASVMPDELVGFARERLAHYKCPRSVELVERLPRDENGKVRKRELREPYWAGRDARI